MFDMHESNIVYNYDEYAKEVMEDSIDALNEWEYLQQDFETFFDMLLEDEYVTKVYVDNPLYADEALSHVNDFFDSCNIDTVASFFDVDKKKFRHMNAGQLDAYIRVFMSHELKDEIRAKFEEKYDC